MSSEDAYQRAARTILRADYLLIATGAGFSADSGLAVYADVAKNSYYASREKDYADLANTSLLMEDPELFWKFWGDCRRSYLETAPHSGYDILNQWCNLLPRLKRGAKDSAINAWYVYSSNVDGHFRRFDNLSGHLCEMHGCVEESVCSSSLGYFVSREHREAASDPATDESGYSISIQERSMDDTLRSWTARGSDAQRAVCRSVERPTPLDTLDETPVPVCSSCNIYPLRPLVVMFGDVCPNVIPRIWNKIDAYQQWQDAMETEVTQRAGEPKRLVVLELGCGMRVPSVRREVEDVVSD
ncbi:unnamed protein product, partial [Ectocarpus fasciculatus]